MDTKSPSTPTSLMAPPVVMLAPMAGVTDRPFRQLAYRFGCPLAWTEMVASRELLRGRDRTFEAFARYPTTEPSLNVQILGGDPDLMAEAARVLEGMGATRIDINMGCPVRKVVGTTAGSALMQDEVLAGRIMKSVVDAVQVPVSIKTRLGWDEGRITAPSLAVIAEESGIRTITIHARTRSQRASGLANWGAVRLVKEAVNIPVVINGDISGVDSARKALAVSGADGVMIARAALGAPWVPGRLYSALKSGAESDLAPPSFEERLNVMLEHLEGLLSTYGNEAGIRISRKHMIWYARFLPDPLSWVKRYVQADTPREAHLALREAGNMLSSTR